ncbi:MAG: D-arabinono-1,4-lactone oxidase [Solirubrobacterales bacterium]
MPGARDWRNWAGDQRCRPARIEQPVGSTELAAAVDGAAADGLKVRAAGSGHSFTEIALTDGVMIDLSRMGRVIDFDSASGQVKVEAGVNLGALGEELWLRGRAMENLGDIDKQSLAGAVSTATHGTGSRLRNISSQIEALELVTGNGSLATIDGSDPAALSAARVGLGALGILATLTLRTVPAFTVHRVDSPLPINETLAGIQELADAADHFEFFVFPHTDTALLRQSERTDLPPRPRGRVSAYVNDVLLENHLFNLLALYGRRRPQVIPRLSRLFAKQLAHSESTDRSYRVFANERRVRFTEMEYGIPRVHAAEAVARVKELAEAPDLDVSFPIEVRFTAGDQALLSTAEGRDTCYIAVHMFKGMAWEPYFRRVEELMDGYGGRPHWGKRHFQRAETLAPRYAGWDQFRVMRERLDPGGRFANDYTDRVLGRMGTSPATE